MRRRSGLSALLFLGCLVQSSILSAQAARVFVSARNGNDSNSCDDVNTPCRTFAGAVTQLSPDGAVIVLDSGGYGLVTITQGVTIEAKGVTAFIHAVPGPAITINAPSATVTLRGLTLNVGTGDGIRVNTAGAVHIENCVISGFVTGINSFMQGQLFLKDTIVRNCIGDAVAVGPTGGGLTTMTSVYAERCRFDNNARGFSALAGSNATLRDCVASGNTDTGIEALTVSGGGVLLTVENCVVSNNGTGIQANGPTGGVQQVNVSGCTVSGNVTGLRQSGGGTIGLLSRQNNTVVNNTTPTAGTITTFMPI